MTPDLAKLADAVEQAATNFSRNCNAHNQTAYDMAVTAWLAARRAARAAGMIECLLSREAVEALRDIHDGAEASEGLMAHVLRLVLQDLDALLKEPT
jgi:hypothetical protein